MEPGTPKQSRLLTRLLGRLRGDRSAMTRNILSFSSTGTTESVGCGSTYDEEESPKYQSHNSSVHLAANIDMRYAGQYLTPEQLPEFCRQLGLLVDGVRNIQSYGRVVGEYPRDLERQLEQEASEVAALASEARFARDTITRMQLQRRALKLQRSQINLHLRKLRESEIRELETSVRIADRKLYRSWEAIRDSKDPEAYESLLDEVKNKQKTLSYMLQLIENRQALLLREQKNEAEDDAVVALPTRKNQDNRRCFKRRKRAHESKSDHKTQVAPKQVTLYITGSSTVDETESSRRSSELPSMEMSQEPTPNIMFFTTCLQPI
ncbi:uncharacterized protein LOC121735992 isoform X2 [Aricia agestis]|uniref:uncharacterized protein LOC121735992 isoform X2 n=1 Tax=Aricia agestis TaxID=91739 RepID=UPI001C208D0E|nr:uncharacterized protein LOC121735992 isoform X2 [Aricia agestis]XP_041982942.1 uncharacterized protein LOC121735992 isoform X2 [Aricia agestis]